MNWTKCWFANLMSWMQRWYDKWMIWTKCWFGNWEITIHDLIHPFIKVSWFCMKKWNGLFFEEWNSCEYSLGS